MSTPHEGNDPQQSDPEPSTGPPPGDLPPSGEQPQQPGFGQQPGQPYPQQPGFGQQPPAPGPGSSGGKGLWIGLGAFIVVAAVAGVLLFVWPGVLTTTVFDHEQMQDDIGRMVTNEYAVDGVDDVSCPDKQEIEVGHEFQCDVTVDGDTQAVTITVESEDGRYEVSGLQEGA